MGNASMGMAIGDGIESGMDRGEGGRRRGGGLLVYI
jgi:hypothetical protein